MGIGIHLFLCDIATGRPTDTQNDHQDMSRSPFMPYLYKHSDWIERMFTFEISLTGKELRETEYEPDDPRYFSVDVEDEEDEDFIAGQLWGREELLQFHKELKKVPFPVDNNYLAKEYTKLVSLVNRAVKDQTLTFLMTTM